MFLIYKLISIQLVFLREFEFKKGVYLIRNVSDMLVLKIDVTRFLGEYNWRESLRMFANGWYDRFTGALGFGIIINRTYGHYIGSRWWPFRKKKHVNKTKIGKIVREIGRWETYQLKHSSSLASVSLLASRVKLINLELWKGSSTLGTFNLYDAFTWLTSTSTQQTIKSCPYFVEILVFVSIGISCVNVCAQVQS